MGKMVLFLSFIGLAVLFSFGIFYPDSSVMWLASTSLNFTILRFVLMVVLIGLLITNPPRSPYFRAFVGIVTMAVAGWSLVATYQNQMQLLDTMSLLQVCITAGIVVLERKPQHATQPVTFQSKLVTTGT